VVRVSSRVVEGYRYQPGPRLDCPITVLVGDRDPQTTIDEASAWREHCDGEFAMRILPGGHFYLDAHRAEIVDILTSALRAPGMSQRPLGRDR
jgi:pyochelin biosynthesis protein PchC